MSPDDMNRRAGILLEPIDRREDAGNAQNASGAGTALYNEQRPLVSDNQVIEARESEPMTGLEVVRRQELTTRLE
jgi:hypothetical protein